jgi:ketosteroid isomerase-like protein
MDVPAGSTPGSDEAMAIVLDYLGALAKGDARGAYALLHESYQKRVPYADYVQGYGPIVGIEIHAIEARQLDGYRDLVHAGVTISTTVHGQTRADDWLATFEVLVTRGRPPYQRSITQVAMERIEAE